MFFCVLLYIFILFLSLKCPGNFFLYHLGSDLKALEVGRFFANSSKSSFTFIISALGTLLDAGGFSVHSVTCTLDTVWLIVQSHVTWLGAEFHFCTTDVSLLH